MGVPALFRWLSQKYPKIVLPVLEVEPTIVAGDDGETATEIPVDIRQPNPNGQENDCLYLDMNGIVHPCTHPEGKEAPATEGKMMIEVFKYTERVVNMARPRKVLLMAIDGVAPRAKMNQQRSRRFRSSEEAKERAKDKEQAIKEFEALGRVMSDEFKQKKPFDSNAITPGTPFMDLLAMSLRYWVAYKLNTDPGWANLQVIISDASVPGEGEHKIMDFVRRQRSQPGYDPNTTHVFYGLDADLIMLSLATHEPNFRILREDVFAQAAKRGCHKCGLPGHHSNRCDGIPPEEKQRVKDLTSKVLKPFIFLDVAVLREYLEVELNVPGLPFAFSLERAIDDWVFMIFFVGNDFLPHLPSLDIREGAIDLLLEIWRKQLPLMGGYLTDNGRVDLEKAQLIMEGLAAREDDIFRKRREEEIRQEEREAAKKARIENDRSSYHNNSRSGTGTPQPHQAAAENTPAMRNGVDYVPVVQPIGSFASQATVARTEAHASAHADRVPASLPAKAKSSMFITSRPVNAPIRGGFIPAASGANGSTSVADNAAQRVAAHKANLSAADKLRAELLGGKASVTASGSPTVPQPAEDSSTKEVVEPDGTKDAVITTPPANQRDVEEDVPAAAVNGTGAASASKEADATQQLDSGIEPSPSRGKKRSADEAEIASTRHEAEKENGIKTEDNESSSSADEDEDTGNMSVLAAKAKKPLAPKPLVKQAGSNVVEQEDTVKLWEPGYKQRYYEQKFGVPVEDAEFRSQVAKAYVEGLSWVLAYYYQGCPSWTWYYPYHFAPFASDFTDLPSMKIEFDLGQPFKPFEQLMGVFPAASRTHIPEAFQGLMIEADSEILDFYPEEFDVDMNGKKMLWQGVALLPFIDQTRLLDALAKRYPLLSEDEVRRNTFGHDVVFVAEENPLFAQIANLYMKRKIEEPVPMDVTLSRGIRGALLPTEDYVPDSTFVSPLAGENLSDIRNDSSISAHFFVCDQAVPHRSTVLNGYKVLRRILNPGDIDTIKSGGRHRPQNGQSNGYNRGEFHASRQNYDSNRGPPRDARNVSDPRQPQQGGSQYQPPQYGVRSGWEASNNQNGSSRPPAQYGGYGGYGGSGQSNGYNAGYGASRNDYPSSYGGYGNAQPPPPQSSYGAPTSGSGYSSYGSTYAPPPTYGYQPPSHQQQAPSYGSYQPPAAAQPAYGGYGYGQQAPYQPPPQAQGQGYNNRAMPLPPHLQQNSNHQRWR